MTKEKQKLLQARVPVDLADKLDAEAKAAKRTRSSHLAYILEQRFAEAAAKTPAKAA